MSENSETEIPPPPYHEARRISSTGCLSGALFGGLTVASLLITAFIAEGALGRPSSTSGIILVFVPIYGGIAAAVGAAGGAAIGLLAEVIARRKVITGGTRIAFIVIPSILGVIGAAIYATAMVVEFENRSSPRVIHSDGRLEKRTSDPRVVSSESASDGIWAKSTFIWNGNEVGIERSQNAIRIVDSANDTVSETPLEEFDYIVEAKGLPVQLDAEAEYLVVIADLRATSNRAMLLVYDPAGRMIYQELLQRHGGPPRLRAVDATDDRDGFFLDVGEAYLYAFQES